MPGNLLAGWIWTQVALYPWKHIVNALLASRHTGGAQCALPCPQCYKAALLASAYIEPAHLVSLHSMLTQLSTRGERFQ